MLGRRSSLSTVLRTSDCGRFFSPLSGVHWALCRRLRTEAPNRVPNHDPRTTAPAGSLPGNDVGPRRNSARSKMPVPYPAVWFSR